MEVFKAIMFIIFMWVIILIIFKKLNYRTPLNIKENFKALLGILWGIFALVAGIWIIIGILFLIIKLIKFLWYI